MDLEEEISSLHIHIDAQSKVIQLHEKALGRVSDGGLYPFLVFFIVAGLKKKENIDLRSRFNPMEN